MRTDQTEYVDQIIMQKFYRDGEDGLLDNQKRSRYDGLSSSCELNKLFELPP
ncbi:hypothetical protein [Gimesia aquarii]|uniref:hypothetical protein n=1 Tax=Gimesia aquarii TaxID=2527964 RepID=UPI0018D7329E|nr:hypothetical protein [Gimesia aquarii]